MASTHGGPSRRRSLRDFLTAILIGFSELFGDYLRRLKFCLPQAGTGTMNPPTSASHS
ncbi:hypothetical protein SBI_01130 [Streptomyces bingchenggensis BCW-1]|uniref:Uncharacterized protein n=1 Tax=Streptomyces bingchenggensis (strain BCW-1) TaxID=749414 RepID=D7C890_STRBB|nr:MULTISPECIES: hypothetical protein [Streptomyces]ADI04251.1 hypothetical protein SBI_01130 [Streptomyces bingchenggensis BCW-1]